MTKKRIFWEKDIALLPIFDFASRGKERNKEMIIEWGDRLKLVMNNKHNGLPGSFDFKVFSELMLRASHLRENSEFPKRIQFRLSNFAKSLGLQPGGRQLHSI